MTKKKNTVLGFDKITVLGHDFKIVETDDANDLILDNALSLGIVKLNEREIVLNKKQPIGEMEQALYHEILHVIDWIMHNEKCEYGEDIINTLARGLATIRLGGKK